MPPPSPLLRDAQSFTLLLPAGLVTFSFPDPSSPDARRRITIPRGSPWAPGAHWHEHYTEYTRVVKGRVKFTIGGQVCVKGPEDGVVTFPKFVVHDFSRADGGLTGGGGGGGGGAEREDEDEDDGDVIIEEWTDPEDGFKLIFFRNVMSALADPALSSPAQVATATRPPTLTLPLLLQLMTTIAYVDNYVDPLPFLPNSVPNVLSIRILGRAMEGMIFGAKYTVTHGLYAMGSFVGRCAGYQSWRKEYTPEDLWQVAERGAYPYRTVKGQKGD